MLRQDTDCQKGLINPPFCDILYALRGPRGHERVKSFRVGWYDWEYTVHKCACYRC